MPADDNLTLRQALRDATAAQHDRLDARVTAMDVTQADDYRAFLSMQLMARAPIEAWLAAHVPDSPPPLAVLIMRDLEAMAAPIPPAPPFTLPDHADPIGACWAIAGSSMGNRAMLHHLTKDDKGDGVPTQFLADAAMTEYWRSLKPRLEAPAGDAADAVIAAAAVFAAFIAAAEACLPESQSSSWATA